MVLEHDGMGLSLGICGIIKGNQVAFDMAGAMHKRQ